MRNNLLGSQIRNRNGGTNTSGGDLTSVALSNFATWFATPATTNFTLLDGSGVVNLGAVAHSVIDDYCSHPRNVGSADIGAIECATSSPCNTARTGTASIIK